MNCGLKLAKLNVEKSHVALQCQLHASNASQQNNPVKIEWQTAVLITQLSHLIMNFTRRWKWREINWILVGISPSEETSTGRANNCPMNYDYSVTSRNLNVWIFAQHRRYM